MFLSFCLAKLVNRQRSCVCDLDLRCFSFYSGKSVLCNYVILRVKYQKPLIPLLVTGITSLRLRTGAVEVGFGAGVVLLAVVTGFGTEGFGEVEVGAVVGFG